MSSRDDERARLFAWGYLTALAYIRRCHSKGVSWQSAVTDAGKMLTRFISEGLSGIGGDAIGEERAAEIVGEVSTQQTES